MESLRERQRRYTTEREQRELLPTATNIAWSNGACGIWNMEYRRRRSGRSRSHIAYHTGSSRQLHYPPPLTRIILKHKHGSMNINEYEYKI
jgi:hypothetical protein